MADNKMTRKASDAAIERVAERWGQTWCELDYGDRLYPHFTKECDREQALSDALRAYFGTDVPDSLAEYVLPVVVDPIVQMAKDLFAEEYRRRGWVLGTNLEDSATFQVALSVARAIAAQGGGE